MKRVLALLLVAGCTPDYSPDTYASGAVQQASKVEQGVVAGIRRVLVSATGTAGAVTGAAAGGIAGAQAPGGGVRSALTSLGGSVVGGLVGAGVERAAGDTAAFEYIVRKKNGELVSVTQKDEVPLALNQRVLVIAGPQARVVPDYIVAEPTPPPPPPTPPPPPPPPPPVPPTPPSPPPPAPAPADPTAPAAP